MVDHPSKPAPRAARHRGRPQQLPEDFSPALGHRVDTDKRIAWLLATSRLSHGKLALRHQEGFAQEMRNQGFHVDNSRISRWESGTRPVPLEAVAGYETLLGLPRHSLVAVAVGLRRNDGDRPLEHRRLRRQDYQPRELDELFTEAGSGRASGTTWLTLGDLVSRADRVYLPPDLWHSLCQRLINELQRSIGAAYVRRLEACHLMLTDPIAQRHLLRAIGELVTDPRAQITQPAVSLLVDLPDPAASALLLRMLESSHASVRRAAMSSTSAKLRRGHFSGADILRIEKHVVAALRIPRPTGGGLTHLDQAHSLPEAAFVRVCGQLRDDRQVGGLLLARQHGLLVPPATAHAVAQRLRTRVQQAMGGVLGAEPDPMLERLIAEALFHVHRERRQHAGLILGVSRYAAVLAQECVALVDDDSELIASRALGVLQAVGLGKQRQRLLRTIADADGSLVLRVNAVNALALSPEALAPEETTVVEAVVARAEEPETILRAALFALGMNAPDRLTALRTHPRAEVAAAAAWWSEQGSALKDDDDTHHRRPVANPDWLAEINDWFTSPEAP